MSQGKRGAPIVLLAGGDASSVLGSQAAGVVSAELAVASLEDGQQLPDLTTRRQVHDLVVAFYRELVNDEMLGPVFEEVAEVDWSHHIPLLIDYWCRILLGDQSYQGTLLMAHRLVHDLQPFTTEHFDRWYGLWGATIDGRWAGPLAEKAKAHAARIATTLARQLPQFAWDPVRGPVDQSE